MKVGDKRNILLTAADGTYLSFVDDDDWVSGEYVPTVIRVVRANPDVQVVGFVGAMSSGPRFVHSVHVGTWYGSDGVYYRPPNHLNPMKSSIAKQFRFLSVDNGEDHAWSMAIAESGLLKKEHLVADKIMYYYRK